MTSSPPPPPAGQLRPRSKQVLAKLILGFVSAAVSLVLCEVLLRLFSPGYSPLFLDIYRLDDYGVLGLRPNVTRRHLTAEWDVTVAINGEGLRDRSTPMADAGGRILGVGDSFAFGWGVEVQESFLFRAEELLRPEAIRVVKAGIPGTGPNDQLLWLQHHGESFRPGLVIVSFFVGNDFVDVQMGGVAKQFTVRDGLMARKSLDEQPPSLRAALVARLKRSSLLAQKVAELLWLFERRTDPQNREHRGLNARDRWLSEFFQVHLRTPPPETMKAGTETVAILEGIRQWCAQRQIPLLLLVIPRSLQVYDWELERWQQAFRSTEALDVDRPQRLLAEWAAQSRVPFCDLLPPFRQYVQAHPQVRLYFYPDAHLNAAGHRLAATVLADYLREHKLVLGSSGTPPMKSP